MTFFTARGYVFLFLIWVVCSASSALALEVVVDDRQPIGSQKVGQGVEYIRDESKSLTLRQVTLPSQSWQTYEKDVLSFGFDNAAYWARFSVTSQASEEKSLLLEIAYPILDDIQIYLFSDAQPPQSLSLGDTLPFSNRPIDHHNFLLPLELQPDETLQVYVRVSTMSSMQVPFVLWNTDAFYKSRTRYTMGQGLYFGMLLVMAIYNLFIYFAVRHRSYIYYAGSVVGMMFFMASLHGFGFQYLWPQSPRINEWAVVAFLGFFGSCACAFTLTFLRLHRHSRVLYNVMMFHLVAYVLVLISAFVLPYRAAILFAVAVGFSACVSAAIAGIVQLHKGQREARYYVLAYGSLLLASVVIALNKMGILPRVFFTEYAMQISSMMEVVLLSFALADRINIERRQKYAAKQQAVELEKKARDEHERYLQFQFESKVEELKSQQKVVAAEAESRAKSDFLATMSHEIRTPMNGVLGMADLLKSTRLDDEQKQYLDVINSSGKALLNIINDILDYSKVAAGKMQLESIEFDLKNVCEECLSVFNPSAEEKNIELRLHYHPSTPSHIKSDPTRLRQVILNLLSNAMKFTEAGSIELFVAPETQQEAKKRGQSLLRFEVKDTGIGVSDELNSQLFEAFSQADSSVTRKFGGTGLGLSISQRLIELMQGQIGVHGQPGEGSTFWFTIGYLPVQHHGQSGTSLSARGLDLAQAKGLLEGKRILVVEDNSVNKLVIRGLLKRLNVEILSADNGEEALALLKQQHASVDLVLMDCEMPVMDGYSATQALRQFESDNQLDELPVLALTAHVLREHRVRAEAVGMNDHLSKPVDFEHLLDKLLQYLAQGLPDISSSSAKESQGVLDTGTRDR